MYYLFSKYFIIVRCDCFKIFHLCLSWVWYVLLKTEYEYGSFVTEMMQLELIPVCRNQII